MGYCYHILGKSSIFLKPYWKHLHKLVHFDDEFKYN